MSPCEVQLGKSLLIGVEDPTLGVQKFLGIPYAQPPTGPQRFQKPQTLPENYEYGKNHTEFASICPQPLYKVNDNPMNQPAGSSFSEDCLYLNLWKPSGSPPAAGWPVLAWIHGGWFQIGNPSQGPENDPSELISSSGAGLQAIVVTIGYRLNVFGFLSCSNLNGNFGLWDQRMALEWIHDNVEHFGGNPGNVTLAGLSAGANSVHQQINYEFFESRSEPIFHRAIMYSNAISAQPKKPEASDDQFDELCRSFEIDTTLALSEKLDKLRKIKDTDLAERLLSLEYHTFRYVTYDEFVSSNLIQRAESGAFAKEFKKRDFKLIIGEVENEETVYRAVNPPKSKKEFLPQLENYYSREISRSLQSLRSFPTGKSENDPEAWKDLFGQIVAASQVRASTRCLVSQLFGSSHNLSTADIFRYRISYRVKALTQLGVPEAMGIGHGMDQFIWWYSARMGLTDPEVKIIKEWLEPWKQFIHGRGSIDWGTTQMKQYRSLNNDGTISIKEDKYWGESESFADVLMARKEAGLALLADEKL